MKLTEQQIPDDVVAEFRKWMGEGVDLSNVYLIPSDGCLDAKHGECDFYILRREMTIWTVWKYQDGHLFFKR